MQNSIYKIKYLLFLSWDWEAWCLTQSGRGGVITPSPERNTAWNKGRKCFHCLGAPNNLIRPCVSLYICARACVRPFRYFPPLKLKCKRTQIPSTRKVPRLFRRTPHTLPCTRLRPVTMSIFGIPIQKCTDSRFHLRSSTPTHWLVWV